MEEEKRTDRKFYDCPLIPLVLCLITGMWTGSVFPGHPFLAGIFLSASLLWVLADALLGKGALFSPLALFLVIGHLCVSSLLTSPLEREHVVHHIDRGWYRLEGEVVETPLPVSGGLRFVAGRLLLDGGDGAFPVAGKIRVTVGGGRPALAAGDRVRFRGKIRSVRNFSNPGGFDYRRHMTLRGVFGLAYVRDKNLTVFAAAKRERLLPPVSAARERIGRLIEAGGGNPEARGVLLALLTGERGRMSKETKEAFARAGVGHLLAISGLHMGIVASVSFILARGVLSFCSFLLWRGWLFRASALVAIMAVMGYGVLAGMSEATSRATIMVILFLATYFTGRSHTPLNTLAIAALILLAANPPSLFSISFQLSFTAVLVILYGISQRPAGTFVKRGAMAKAAAGFLGFLKVSLLAIFGTLPLGMLYFNRVSLVGPLSNIFLVPLVGFCVVPLGLASVCVIPLSPELATFGMGLACRLLGLAIGLIRILSGLPHASSMTVTPSAVELLLYYLLLWSILGLIGKEGGKRRWAGIAAVVAMLGWGADIAYWTCQRFFRDDLRVTVMDVGQGSAALIELPSGACMMVDGGGYSDNARFDMGQRVVAPLLLKKKIRTIETLVLTHPQSDHLNGLTYLAEHFNVETLWSNHQQAATLGYRRLMETVEEKGIEHPPYHTLPRDRMVAGVRIRIVHPPAGFGKDKGERNPNNNSLVLRVSLGEGAVLFTGDIEKEAEAAMALRHGESLGSTVLVAPHHGSRTSSTAALLHRVLPDAVVISLGWKNRFRFPAGEVLARYGKFGARVYRTDLHGAVRIRTDGNLLTIDPFLKTPGAEPLRLVFVNRGAVD